MIWSLPVRILAILIGLGSILLAVTFCVSMSRRFYPSPYWRIPDGESAGVFRTRAHKALLFGPPGGFLVALGVLGRNGLADAAVGVYGFTIMATVAIVLWERIERELAWPGLLVPPEVRDVPGDFFARRGKGRAQSGGSS